MNCICKTAAAAVLIGAFAVGAALILNKNGAMKRKFKRTVDSAIDAAVDTIAEAAERINRDVFDGE